MTLELQVGERRSPLYTALLQQLRLVAAETHVLSGEEGTCLLPASVREFGVRLGEIELARIFEGAVVGEADLLSPLESRFLSETGRPLARPASAPDFRPLTDLHTHFAGCLSAEALVQIGVEAGLLYPLSLLEEIGIRAQAAGRAIPLTELPPSWRARLVAALQIPLDRRIPFLELQRIYLLRSPLTKDLRTFLPQCRRLAEDYRAMGVRYAELSLANVVETERLQLIHRELPAIEREFGVELRFLAGIGRQNDYEWDLDLIARIQSLAGSVYVAGVDFMGQEVNSTRDFARQIDQIAAWADRERPGFVIRVHAGENPAHPENVRVALEAAGEREVALRIGHGLYGTDEATLDLLARRGVIVEFNLNSNFALNNLQSAAEAPIARYAARGVPLVLGTDGCGIYQTTSALEARAALLAGLPAAQFEHIRRTEMAYLERRRRADAPALAQAADYVVPPEPAPVHYTPEVPERKRQEALARARNLAGRLEELGVPLLDAAGAAALLREHRCVAFAGAWKKSWELVPPAQRGEVERELELLLRALPAGETVLLTGGTCLGVEGVIARLARRIGLPVLGVLVSQSPPEALVAGGLTHAHVVAERLHQKAEGLYRLLRAHDIPTVFIGGGQIVSDEIQTARNLRVRHALMTGLPGASADHAVHFPELAFATHERALALLARPTRTPGPLFHLGVNPTADAVVLRRRPGSERLEILLIQRDVDAEAEGGRWALPGGFVRSLSARGEAFVAGETTRAACLRELYEETGLELEELDAHLVPVGDYEGGGRDPRDTAERWIRSSAFAVLLPGELGAATIASGSDAGDVGWFPLEPLPVKLAFDHERIVAEARRKLEV